MSLLEGFPEVPHFMLQRVAAGLVPAPPSGSCHSAGHFTRTRHPTAPSEGLSEMPIAVTPFSSLCSLLDKVRNVSRGGIQGALEQDVSRTTHSTSMNHNMKTGSIANNVPIKKITGADPLC